MVWFYLITILSLWYSMSTKSPFNPTMVWFYQTITKVLKYAVKGFQSHYGLILSVSDWNSEVCRKSLSIPLWSDFIMSILNCCDDLIFSFNPTMVWFYLIWMAECKEMYIFFQSHYGLILSCPIISKTVRASSLSIPLWSDFIKCEIVLPPFF